MSRLRMLRGGLLSAGIMAGLLGSVALAPSAYAQPYGSDPFTLWSPPAYGYYGDGASASGYGYGPNWGGWAATPGGNNVPGLRTPYWLGAPQTIGPG
jgi:hypothetical protein